MAAGRGRKALLVLVVLVLVLVGLFVAVDRVAVYAAERTVASKVRQELTAQDISTPRQPKVTIGGFPFLTQVARGRYSKITIDVVSPSTRDVSFDDLTVVATGVRASTGALINGNGKVTADNVTGTGRFGWDTVAKLIDPDQLDSQAISVTGPAAVSATSSGEVRIAVPVRLASTISTTVEASGTIGISGDSVRVHVTKATLQGGDVPPLVGELLGGIEGQLSVSLKIPELPYHLEVRKVVARPDGAVITATATNVPITGGG